MASLKRRLIEHGVRQSDVADAAHVGREMVCNVLSGRDRSQRVVEVAERLLREKVGAQAPNHSERKKATSKPVAAAPTADEPEIT